MGRVPISVWVMGIYSELERYGGACSLRSVARSHHYEASCLDIGNSTPIMLTSELLLETMVLAEFQSGATIMGSPHPHPSMPAPSHPFLV